MENRGSRRFFGNRFAFAGNYSMNIPHLERRLYMKRSGFTLKQAICLVAVLAMAFASVASASAQAKPMGKNAVRAWFKNLEVTDAELKEISAAVEADEATIAKAQAEIKIAQSKIARLMLESAPDMGAIGAEVDKSLESEKVIRMAQIKRQLEVRRVLGEDRWKTVLLLVKEARVAQAAGRFSDSFSKQGINPKDAESWSRLLFLLRKIM